MAYTLTDDQKGWLAELANVMVNLSNAKTTVNDNDLDSLENKFASTDQGSQVTAFKAWVKGGVRPTNPH